MDDEDCIVAGCDRKARARGMCARCYQRWDRARPDADRKQWTPEVQCEVCGTRVPRSRRTQRFCSIRCGRTYYNRRAYKVDGRKICRTCHSVLPFDRFEGNATMCNGCMSLQLEGKKRCSTCGEIKELAEYFPRRRRQSGCEPRCKDCSRAESKKWNARPEVRERVRNRHYLYRFGMSVHEYDRRVAEQGGRCIICGKPPDGVGRLHVDHDHACCPGERSCGRCLRGIICFSCNTALGAIKDDPLIALAMASYLARYSTVTE